MKCDPKDSGQHLVKLTLKHLIGTLAVAVSGRQAIKCQTRCITNSDLIFGLSSSDYKTARCIAKSDENQDRNLFDQQQRFRIVSQFGLQQFDTQVLLICQI